MCEALVLKQPYNIYNIDKRVSNVYHINKKSYVKPAAQHNQTEQFKLYVYFIKIQLHAIVLFRIKISGCLRTKNSC